MTELAMQNYLGNSPRPSSALAGGFVLLSAAMLAGAYTLVTSGSEASPASLGLGTPFQGPEPAHRAPSPAPAAQNSLALLHAANSGAILGTGDPTLQAAERRSSPPFNQNALRPTIQPPAAAPAPAPWPQMAKARREVPRLKLIANPFISSVRPTGGAYAAGRPAAASGNAAPGKWNPIRSFYPGSSPAQGQVLGADQVAQRLAGHNIPKSLPGVAAQMGDAAPARPPQVPQGQAVPWY